MRPKRYLVTGGLGFIGSALVNRLKGSVTVLSRSDDGKERLTNKNVKILIKELGELAREDVEKCDVIYHFASTVDNYNILTDPYIDTETNIKGTIRLLELCKDMEKKPKIIYPSTFFVYGNEHDHTKEPMNEESKTDPLGVYPATKLCAESIIKLYSRLYAIPYLITRFTNVYGAGENFGNPKKAWLNFAIMRAVRGEDLTLYRDGNFYRDYIYVDDVVKALMFLERRTENQTFLVGFGKPVKFKDMIDYVLKHTGGKSKIIEVEPPPFHHAVGLTNFAADTSKINALGWRAEVDYTEGLRKVIDHYKSLCRKDQSPRR